MGGEQFVTFAEGENAQIAFRNAVDQAQYDYGHAGYTGTIAEKPSVEMRDTPDVVVPEHEDPKEAFKALCSALEDWAYSKQSDINENDKWGPAFGIYVGEYFGRKNYMFYGWASS